MYICICEAVTEKQIHQAVHSTGQASLRSVRAETGACSQCGKCASDVRSAIRACQQARSAIPVRSAA